MPSPITRTVLAACAAIAVPVPAGAQQAPVDVTFQVPLNLSRLPASVATIRVSCTLNSAAILRHPGERLSQAYVRAVSAEFPVSQGEVVQTAQLVISLESAELDSPSGKQATYECDLFGFDAGRQTWTPFRVGHGDLILTPTPAVLSGQFVW